MRVLVTILGLAAVILGFGALWVGWSGSYVTRWDELRGAMARLELVASLLMIGLGIAGVILVWIRRPRLAQLLLAACAGAGVLGALIALVVTQVVGTRQPALLVIALSGGATVIPAALGAWLAPRAAVSPDTFEAERA